MTPILAIANRKGGSGKSSTSVNLAAEFGNRGARVLLVDLDTQGHAGLGFGFVPKSGDLTVHHMFKVPGFCLVDAIRTTPVRNVTLVPADPMFDGMTIDRSAFALARKLRDPALSAQYDLIVLDTPPALDVLLISALAAADGVIVPVLPHALSAEGVKQITRLFFMAATKFNWRLSVTGILPVMLNPRINHHSDVMEYLVSQFGPDKVLRGIRTDIKIAEAFSVRKPVQFHAPDSAAVEDFRQLADDVIASGLWAKFNHLSVA